MMARLKNECDRSKKVIGAERKRKEEREKRKTKNALRTTLYAKKPID